MNDDVAAFCACSGPIASTMAAATTHNIKPIDLINAREWARQYPRALLAFMAVCRPA